MTRARPAMTDADGADLLRRVKSGTPVRDLSTLFGQGAIRRYLNENPAFCAEVRAASLANERAKKKLNAQRRMADKTHCVQGHELSGDNVFIRTYRNGDKGRVCRTCTRLAARAVRPMTPEQVAKVTQLVRRGIPMNRMFHGGTLHVTAYRNMQHQRMIDPAFDRMMADHASRGSQRAARTRGILWERQREDEYRAISALVPRWMDPADREDVAQSVIIALLEKSLRRDQVADRIRLLVTEFNRGQKFGGNRMLSLDVSPFDDGTTRIERVSMGLWQ